jgi:hypothetical protein
MIELNPTPVYIKKSKLPGRLTLFPTPQETRKEKKTGFQFFCDCPGGNPIEIF